MIRRIDGSPQPKFSQATKAPSAPSSERASSKSSERDSSKYESFDGRGNNLYHPDWGSTNVDLLRKAKDAYGDGISTPGGANRPSAREISNTLSAHPPTDTPNNRDLSDMIYVWGQFIDHDLDLTGSGAAKEKFPVQIPKGDPQFDPNGTGTQTIPLTRSEFDQATGTSKKNPRQQINQITAFLDGSMVYGSDPERAKALRAMTGGRMATSAGDLLPFNTKGLPNANDAHVVPDDQLFLAGDVRANENTQLSGMQTLFVREHNRIADEIHAKHPHYSDEHIYQEARKRVIAEIQAVTYNEFLPALLGKDALPKYRGYNPSVNPGISNEFSTAAFRVGHSMLGNDVEFADANGQPVPPSVELKDAFFNPKVLEGRGMDTLMKGIASGNAEEIDTVVVDGVRNFLFGPPGAGGLDLVSLNIQRGRDHGLADYNTTRAAYGLPKVTSFDQITKDPATQAKLKSLYGDVNNIDLWVGALAEDHAAGASVGPLIKSVLVDQFTRLRDGDRFYYGNQFHGKDLHALENTHLSDIIARNTNAKNLQKDVFFFHPPAPAPTHG